MALPSATGDDEFYVRHSVLDDFIADAQATVASVRSPTAALAALRNPFALLLGDRTWLPRAFREPCAQGGMSGGIGQWLLYRSADRSLTLFSLVVPPGVTTPVHDHLAWGLVGLYEGAQEERIYRLTRGLRQGHAELELVEVRHLAVGDFYALLPPEEDIHSVCTTSSVASISLHLLGSDVGCMWRHAYDPERSSVRPFRSGYTNVACGEEAGPSPDG